ncbi:glycosyltransferase [Elusimicrobiota bacterium]
MAARSRLPLRGTARPREAARALFGRLRPRLRRRRPRSGFPDSGPEEKNVRTALTRFGLENRARVLPPTDDIERCYEAADVFVLPSISEGLSNALLEAMASGVAVLGSRVGGTKEAVEDGNTGLLFDPADDEALRAHLRKLAEEPELAGKLGAAGRERAERLFSLEAVADRYLKLYNG